MTDIRKFPIRQPLPLVPEKLIGNTYICIGCRGKNIIDWFESQQFPSQPIKSDVHDGYFVPASITQKCSCGISSKVNIPMQQKISTWNLYGDEAERVFLPGDLPGVSSSSTLLLYHLSGFTCRWPIPTPEKAMQVEGKDKAGSRSSVLVFAFD